jgi:hypothetical protein
MRLRKVSASAAILLASGSAAFGLGFPTTSWTNPAGGSWQNSANWSNGVGGNAGAAVFNLNSAGYTATLNASVGIYTPTGMAVENDIVTVNMNGFGITTPTLSVGAPAGEESSLTLVGPGTVTLTGSGTTGQGSGAFGGGPLTLNGATIRQSGLDQGEGFNGHDLLVENGGLIVFSEPNGPYTISNSTFNNGSVSGSFDTSVGINNVTLSNNSSVRAQSVTVDNATIGGSSNLSGNTSMSIFGTLNLLAGGGAGGVDATNVNGAVNIYAGGQLGGTGINVSGGETIMVELNASVNGPMFEPQSSNGGILDFTLQSGFTPTVGEVFPIFASFGQYGDTGTFASVTVPALPGGESWDISHLYTNGTITVVPEPIGAGLMICGIALMLRRRRQIRNVNN